MEETAEHQRQMLFHLTGAFDGHLEPVDSTVRPALLARYRDLAGLRYDFPVVLVEDSADGAFVCSLTSVVDDVLQEIAPRGAEGERVRRQVLHAEREIRRLVAEGARGLLTELWERAAPNLADVGARLKVDGELADCDHELPRRLVEHAWHSVQRGKAARFHAEVNRLVQALSDILRAAFIHSEAGRRPESLRAAFGSPHHEQFDFETMSRLLGSGEREGRPPRRPARADRVGARGAEAATLLRRTASPFEYRYDSCADAAGAFRQRLPELVEFVKAMSIADLEADGRYVPSEHDAVFERFDEESLTDEDLALFPDYLVCVDAHESAAAMELLSSGLPVKVLVDTEELLDPGRFGFGMRNTQLASTAVGLVDVFTLQTTSSNLYQLRERAAHRPAVHRSDPRQRVLGRCDAVERTAALPHVGGGARGACLSRVHVRPDRRTGPRFALLGRGEPAARARLAARAARVRRRVAPARRGAGRVHARRLRGLRPALRAPLHCASRASTGPTPRFPSTSGCRSTRPRRAHASRYILVIDEQDSLQRLIVDAKLMQAARRCREVWRGLKELSLAHVRTQTAPLVEAPTEAVEEPAAEPPTEQPVAEERLADDPWIETPRCSTCNECTTINDRMFAYNDDKQAYIKDPDAGTFRELVEAAEACQVAIIHPGKPRNSNEPGLEELVERARAFQ